MTGSNVSSDSYDWMMGQEPAPWATTDQKRNKPTAGAMEESSLQVSDFSLLSCWSSQHACSKTQEHNRFFQKQQNNGNFIGLMTLKGVLCDPQYEDLCPEIPARVSGTIAMHHIYTYLEATPIEFCKTDLSVNMQGIGLVAALAFQLIN